MKRPGPSAMTFASMGLLFCALMLIGYGFVNTQLIKINENIAILEARMVDSEKKTQRLGDVVEDLLVALERLDTAESIQTEEIDAAVRRAERVRELVGKEAKRVRKRIRDLF